MAISYGELAEIEAQTNEQLVSEWKLLVSKHGHTYTQDDKDRQNAIETEMESRGLEHP